MAKGEKNKNIYGVEMTIIGENTNGMVDVEFENGYRSYKRTYEAFKNGKIAHFPRGRKTTSRKGEKRMASCGLMMEIIEYRHVNDIDVMFEDGTIRERCYYSAFVAGSISHPKYESNSPNSIEKRISRVNHKGETRMMNCGMEATIIEYKSAKHFSVQFADGTIINDMHCYHNFKQGKIRNPKLGRKNIKTDANEG